MSLFFLGAIVGAACGATALYYLVMKDHRDSQLRELERLPEPMMASFQVERKVQRLTNRSN